MSTQENTALVEHTPAATRPLGILEVFGQRKMLALLFLGFASGLPLYLTSQTLQAWMTVEEVDLTTIGLFSLVTLPYSLKFLWAPLFDAYVPPFLGRRRGWLVITQVGLILAIAAMALQDPERALRPLALAAVLIAFFSASQDAVFNGYQVDALAEREMGAGAAIGVLGYRVALIVTGSLALVLADRMTWPTVYLMLAGLMLVGIAASLFAPEPVLRVATPRGLKEAVVDPFVEFFRRTGPGLGVLILLFTILYQLSDRLGQNMATPFLLQTGFSQTEIGVIRGGIGMVATILGVLTGGAVIARLGINRSLWVFMALQILSNLAYYWISVTQAGQTALTVAIVIENVSGGMVTAVFVAFLMVMSSRQFSATQYALLSSLMSVGRDVLAAPAGRVAEATGWPVFFLFTIAAGIPAILLLPLIAPWRAEVPRGAAPHSAEVREDGE